MRIAQARLSPSVQSDSQSVWASMKSSSSTYHCCCHPWMRAAVSPELQRHKKLKVGSDVPFTRRCISDGFPEHEVGGVRLHRQAHGDSAFDGREESNCPNAAEKELLYFHRLVQDQYMDWGKLGRVIVHSLSHDLISP